jgi:hypothetical protein
MDCRETPTKRRPCVGLLAAVTAALAAFTPARAGSYDYSNMMRMRDIIPRWDRLLPPLWALGMPSWRSLRRRWGRIPHDFARR